MVKVLVYGMIMEDSPMVDKINSNMHHCIKEKARVNYFITLHKKH